MKHKLNDDGWADEIPANLDNIPLDTALNIIKIIQDKAEVDGTEKRKENARK